MELRNIARTENHTGSILTLSKETENYTSSFSTTTQHRTTFEDTTNITENSTIWNTTISKNSSDTGSRLVLVIAGTVAGSVLVITIVGVIFLVLCHFSKRKKTAKSKDRVSLGHVYVNHEIAGHGTDGIPRNLSWKSLEQTNMQESNIYSLAKGFNENKPDKEIFDKKNKDISFQKQSSYNEDNYFILEKVYSNDEGIVEDEYVNGIPTRKDEISELKKENNYSLRRVTWPSEKRNQKPEEKAANIQMQTVDTPRQSPADSGVDDVYNTLGEGSRNNSAVAMNYDSMENIFKERIKFEDDHIYENDDDYSDNYNVLSLTPRITEIMSNTYSTTQEIT